MLPIKEIVTDFAEGIKERMKSLREAKELYEKAVEKERKKGVTGPWEIWDKEEKERGS